MRTTLKKAVMVFLVFATVFASVPFTVSSADWIPSSVRSIVFDAKYYSSTNLDVMKAYGSDAEALYNHFLEHGVKEGRQGSPVFHAKYYTNANPSVKQECGNDFTKAILHYAENNSSTELITAPPHDLGKAFEASIKLSYTDMSVIDSNSNAVTAVTDNTDSSQVWAFSRNDDGSYVITNTSTCKVLTLEASSNAAGAKAKTESYNGSSSQHWYIYKSAYGCFVLSSACTSGLVLDVNGASTSANASLQSYTYNATQAQQFNIVLTDLYGTFKCDVNYDGYINSKDVIAVKKDIKSGNYNECSDVNADGKINYGDIELINSHLGEKYGCSYKSFIASDAYNIGLAPDVHTLLTFSSKTYEAYRGVCAELIRSGYEIYNSSVMGGVYSTTLVKGKGFYHIYWVQSTKELSVVEAPNGGYTLPPQDPSITTGKTKTTVTQLKSTYVNGMSYIVQLADGSFVIYDGGYPDTDDDLWNKLVELNNGTSGIVIRAWVLTHGHDDHYRCMQSFATNYASRVKVEYFLVSPINAMDLKSDWDGTFTDGTIYNSINKFAGAKTCYVHTGMRFTFCNTTMEILLTADDIFIENVPDDFNNSSIVSRIYTKSKSVMFLADTGDDAAFKMENYYGKYLKSDICQVAHHGVEDFPLSSYELIRAPILFYPCSNYLYNMQSRFHHVRLALKAADYTKEILIHENGTYTRSLE